MLISHLHSRRGLLVVLQITGPFHSCIFSKIMAYVIAKNVLDYVSQNALLSRA